MSKFLTILLIMLLISPASAQTVSFDNSGKSVNIINLKNLSQLDIDEISSDRSAIAECRINNILITVTNKNTPAKALYHTNTVKSADVKTSMSQPMIARMRGIISPFETFRDRINIIHQEQGTVVFQAPEAILEILISKQSNHFNIMPLEGKLNFRIPGKEVLAKHRTQVLPAEKNLRVDSKRMSGFIQKMQEFKTRYTFTDKFKESAEWAKEMFEKTGLKAKLTTYKDRGKEQYNIVATSSKGLSESGFYILCAHLDSISERSNVLAPGADDNASGSAAVLEIAHILKNSEHLDKICFVLFGGEEVGLKGSSAYVKGLKSSGKISKVKGVVNFDMIGFDKQPPLSALIETKSAHKEFIAAFIKNAESSIKTSVSYHPWGSDHVPFLKANIPCFLFIEDEYEDNHNYHKTTDLIVDVNMQLVEKITESVLQTIAALIKQ